MKKIIWLICLSVTITYSSAQDEPTRSLSELKILLQKSKTDSDRINPLLEMVLIYIRRPGAEKTDIDSALSLLTSAMNISTSLNRPEWQARCFLMYSQLYRETNQIESGKRNINQAIPLLIKYGPKESLGDAYFELQLYYNVYIDSEWVVKKNYADTAERLYKESGNKLKQAAALKHLGDFHQIKGNDSIALEKLYESLSIYQSEKFQQLDGLYDLIGFVLSKKGDFNGALKYGLLAMETAEKLKTDSSQLVTIYNRLGLTCYNLTRYGEASNYFTKAFSIAVRIKDTAAAIVVSPNVMSIYVRLEKQREALAFLQNNKFIYDKGSLENKADYTSIYIRTYLLTNNVKKAEPYVKPLIKLVEGTTDIYIHSRLYRAVIPYYFAAGQYKEMYKYLPDMENFCKQRSFIVGLADNYLWWYKADSALGNYTSAIGHYKLYKEANDSSLHMTANRQINQLMIEYETLKKDQAIASQKNDIKLLTNQAKQQGEQLRQTRVVRNLTYGLAALLLIIVGLLLNGYLSKQRSNKKLQAQQEEINDKNIVLQQVINQKEKLLDEKDWLVKEIHHRVKNNLQIVMSLLNSQSAYIDNEPALTAIHDSQHRVHAMSLIHQKLYNSENVSSIDMSIYVRELVSYLSDSFDTGQRIRFDLNIEPLKMDVSQAVPLGLILNEAITNSIKYAFPDNRNGVISISLSNSTPHHYILSISDNGIGVPLQFKDKRAGSLGMSLMAGLSEDLDGNFSIETNNGTQINISFVHDKGVKKPDGLAASFISNN
jgi:two-component sensor histidine kinase